MHIMVTGTRFGFGKLIFDLRSEKGRSLRDTAKALGIAPSYLSRVENNQKPSLSPERIEALSLFLILTEEEKQALYSLAAQPNVITEDDRELGFNTLPADCIEYAKDIPAVIDTLRFAKEKGLGEKEWRELLNNLKSNN